jgi:predicted component of type VI protein secretion system
MLGKNPGRSPLDRIESRLQSLFEGSLTSLVSWGGNANTLANSLAIAMNANLHQAEDGHWVAPGSYIIQVHPERLPYWQADPRILRMITQNFEQVAGEEGIEFASTLSLHLAIDPRLHVNEVQVNASNRSEKLADTAALKPIMESPHASDHIPPNAFLIVNGDQTFLLHQAVVNIGRRLDNHITIDDPRVSRVHAQLRANRGWYILFDLNSTGGTYVNGQRITQYNLNPGDVISLAGVPLIYGQDNLSNQEQGAEPQISPGTTQEIKKPLI